MFTFLKIMFAIAFICAFFTTVVRFVVKGIAGLFMFFYRISKGFITVGLVVLAFYWLAYAFAKYRMQ